MAVLIDSKHIKEYAHVDGKTLEIEPTSQLQFEENYYQKQPVTIEPAPQGEMDVDIFLDDYLEQDLAIKAVAQILGFGLKQIWYFLFFIIFCL